MPEPKVRFKRDDGNSYPDLVDKKLGDIGTVLMCKRVFREQTDSTGDVPFYKIGTFGGVPDAFISRELYEELKAKYSFPKRGNILLSAAGTIGRTVRYDGEDAFFQDSNIVWLDHNDSVLDDYLYYFYQQASWKNLEGGTIQRLYNGILLDKDISIPSLEEQQKIADFLSSVDEVITASEEEVANLETQKKAVMKKIFSQEVRFKKTDGSEFADWENTALGNLEGKVSSGKDKNEDGNVPLYGSMGPIGTCSVATALGNKILVARVGANAGSVRLVTEDCGVTDNTLIIKDADTCNFCWLYYALVEKNIGKMRFGGGQPLVTGTMLFDLEMDVPCLEEQRLIAGFLSDFDEAIAAAKKELELWKELKKGLLQQMFV